MTNDSIFSDYIALVQKYFDRDYYLQANTDVAKAGIDPLLHYCEYGWKEGRSPNSYFSAREYISKFNPRIDEDEDPFVHYILSIENVRTERLPQIDGGSAMLLPDKNEIPSKPGNDKVASVALSSGRIVHVRPPDPNETALVELNMDSKYYYKMYPEVAVTGVSAAVHYLTIGWIEGKDPSPDFSTSFYLMNNKDIQAQGINPYVHYLKHGKTEKWRKSSDVKSAAVFHRFSCGALAEAVEAAVELDPMVALPLVGRTITSPFSQKTESLKAVKHLRQRFGGQAISHAVIIPHVRMSGSARVAGAFTRALEDLYGLENVVLVLTDGSSFEHPEWFPENVNSIDLFKLLEPVNNVDHKYDIVYDLLYGIDAKTVTNINSRLFWDMQKVYGRQLYQTFRVSNYVFTWDVAESGQKVGYPIQWMREIVDYSHNILCDTEYLASEMRTRFALNRKNQDSTVWTLRTPILPSSTGPQGPAEPKYSPSQRDRSANPKVLWAGRLDRQKRPDILALIADQNPDWQFHVYGRSVLDHSQDRYLMKCSNILLKGEYTDLSEIDLNQYTMFLYTAQWDGLPTILLDIGRIGLPIVASGVGGVGELIDEKTGWLVEPFDDVQTYSSAMQEVFRRPDLAKARATQLKKKVTRMFRESDYKKIVAKVTGDAG